MKINFSSIKFQIIAAFISLLAPLLVFSFLVISSHETFLETLDSTFTQEKFRIRTLSMQRDVMDLQRNVLLYKSVASSSSVKNFNQLYESLRESIETLRDYGDKEYDAALSSMSRHLHDYKNSFDVVVDYRQQRSALVEKHLKSDLRSELIIHGSNQSYDQVMEQLLAAHSASLSFLVHNDGAYIDSFKSHVSSAEGLLASSGESPEGFLERLEQYEKSFLLVVNLTRNYIYLINVVMAGSAQEILYHASEISLESKTKLTQEQISATQELTERKNMIFAISAVALFISISVPVYFFALVTKPIEAITMVFKKLSQGEVVHSIPGSGRADEIGSLADAANVFKAKNEQTIRLLEQAEINIEMEQKLNDELVVAKYKVEQALSAKSEFLANMSHELRTPLNSVIGYTVRLLKKPEQLSERQQGALRTIERNGHHLLALINDVLDLSKMEAEKLELNYHVIDLVALMSGLAEQMRDGAEQKSLALKFDSPHNTLVFAVDEVRISQIVINLLSNAIKYTEQGEIVLGLQLHANQSSVVVSVKDTGIGIRNEDKARLFKRFEQFDKDSRFKIGHGTGLGLAIVANLCKLMHAEVRVESEFGQGSEFIVTLHTPV